MTSGILDVLYCESNYSGTDKVIIQKLGLGAEVIPMGGKAIAKNVAKSHSEIHPNRNIYYLVDRDLDCNWNADNKEKLQENTINKKFIGWSWQRKEIENYLLDPQFIRHFFSWDLEKYQEILNEAAQRIANYQAARLTLTELAPKKPSKGWGTKLFPTHIKGAKNGNITDKTNFKTCFENIVKNKSNLLKDLDCEFKLDKILETFERWSIRCSRDGDYFNNYLYVFSGKELLHAASNKLITLNQSKHLSIKNFPVFFHEKIQTGLGRLASGTTIVDWLEDWTHAKNQILEKCSLKLL